MRVALIILFSVLILLTGAFFILRVPDADLEYLTEKYTDRESKFLEVQEMNVHYKTEGTGTPVLLLHGTGSSLHTWDQWTLIMKDYFKVIRLDLPAYGLTGPFPDRDYSLDSYMEFLNDFMKKLAMDSFHIAGNSFGGYLAWNYALKYPDQVGKLILIDASGYPKDETPSLFRLAKNPVTAFALKSITPKSFIEKNLKEVYHQDELITGELIDRYYELTLREGNRQAFVDRARTDHVEHSDQIKNIRNPTLILWGRYDLWIPLSDGDRFAREIPNSKLIIYENAGHVPMEETPLNTVSDAVDFLE